MKKLFLILGLGVALAGCAAEPKPIAPLAPDFASLGKIYIDTQDMRILDRSYSVPKWSPYVGHDLQPKLADAVKRWADDRLQAVGMMGHTTLIIKDASVSRQLLPVSTELSGMFTREQAYKLVGHVEVTVDSQSPVNNMTGIATANAAHYVTLPEDPTANELQAAYNALVTKIMADLNVNLERAMRDHMPRFLVAAPQQQTGDPAMMAPVDLGAPVGSSKGW